MAAALPSNRSTGDAPADLNRFLQAQNAGDPSAYGQAIAELRAGRKRSHWIWFVLPQLQGLGRSAISQRFGIRGLAEARAYLSHPMLGARWRDTLNVIAEQLSQPGQSLQQLMDGELDGLKTVSSLTLMAQAGCPQAGALLAQLEGEGWKPCGFTLERICQGN
jgi:uncharacterized protein (DUF1810 family)